MTSIHNHGPGSQMNEPSDDLHGGRLEGAALDSRNEELELALAAGRVGFCRIDPHTPDVRANAYFKAEFGWPPDARFDWQELQQRVHREDRERLSTAVSAAMKDGAELALTVRAAWPDGTEQSLALRGRALRSGTGVARCLVITSRNVSAEVLGAAQAVREHALAIAHEQQLRREAEAANRSKDEFLSVISHELRSPLNAILGWIRILSLKRGDDPEVAAIAPRIEQSAKSQLKIVNDLLDLGRLGTGKLTIEPRPVRLAKVVAGAIDLARPAAARKGIDMGTDLAVELGQTRADPDRLQQVVANLLSNAIKFTPFGGRIDVVLRGAQGFSELSISDTGQGIAPELLPHVFDRFRQGDSSITRHAGGLGLGLTLVREIVGLHGGSVAAYSDGVGAGAKFTVRLPTNPPWAGANAAEAALGARGTPRPSSLRGLCILVVDDDLDARTIVAETLRLEGAEVTVTDCAGAAFAHLQAADAHFDIVVSDIGMPEEDGYSLVRRLRALENGRRTLAIAVTGYVSKSDVDAAMSAGFDLHVPKPLDFDTFVPLMRRLAGDAKGPLRG